MATTKLPDLPADLPKPEPKPIDEKLSLVFAACRSSGLIVRQQLSHPALQKRKPNIKVFAEETVIVG